VVNGFGEVQCDVYLDALALMTAHHHRDEDAFNAVLAATDYCPWYLAHLVNALSELGVLALTRDPEQGTRSWYADRFLAEVRQYVMEQR